MAVLQERRDRALSRHRHQIEVGKTVAEGIRNGLSNKEIADKLGLAEGTIRHYRKEIDNGNKTEA